PARRAGEWPATSAGWSATRTGSSNRWPLRRWDVGVTPSTCTDRQGGAPHFGPATAALEVRALRIHTAPGWSSAGSTVTVDSAAPAASLTLAPHAAVLRPPDG